jgi:FkbM family methyltransferase
MSLTEAQRIALACACRDADGIPKVEGAGEVFEQNGVRYQRMHNGLKVVADGYYGNFITTMIAGLRGHHEPQEEKVFEAVLATLPERPVIVELGGYWAFYSMWFLTARPEGRAFIVEPIAHRRLVGEQNLQANHLKATVIAAAMGEADQPPVVFKTGNETALVPVRSVDSLFREYAIGRADILHLDIQGFERLALLGAEEVLSAGRAKWVFVSTHRGLEESARRDIHQDCLELLRWRGYRCVAEHTPEQSFSVDGLIVAKAPGVAGPDSVAISRCSEQDLAAIKATA